MAERESSDVRYTVEGYFDLLKYGLLDEDDRVELLEGIIVSEPPMDPPHAAGIEQVAEVLRSLVGDRAAVRTQAPLLASPYSVPEPDIAVVPGHNADYRDHHPATALLVVEVASSSLKQDRLSKSRIYAGAAIPEYWIVNLRDACIEVFRAPDPDRRLYTDRLIKRRGEQLTLAAFSDTTLPVDDLLPTAA